MARFFALCALVLVAGCARYPGATSYSGSFPAQGPIIPDTTLNISSAIQIPLQKLVIWGTYAGVAYLVLDPLAPNWEIEEASFPQAQYHLSLKMKRVYAGGAGEARQVFHQRAKELMRRGGYAAYEVLDYSEGMDSSVLGSQRVASGVVRLKGS